MTDGISTTNLPLQSSLDEFVGNRNPGSGMSTARVAAVDVARQVGVLLANVTISPTGNIVTDTSLIQSTIDAMSAGGGGIVNLRNGTWFISGIEIKNRVWLRGAGWDATTLQLTGTEAIRQNAANNIYGFSLSDLTIKADGASGSATAIKLSSFQQCLFRNLLFRGFSTGRLLDVQGAVAAVDPNAPIQSSNVIFNRFDVWRCMDACANPIRLKGAYGTTPTPTPANSANAPIHVITKNVYNDLQFFNVTGTAVNIVGACDSERFYGLDIYLTANNAVALNLASDPVFTGNNYCNSHWIELTFAAAAGLNPMTLLKSTGWSFGCHISVEHDQNPAQAGFTLFDIPNWQSYEINGKCLTTYHNAQDLTDISEGRFYLAGGRNLAQTPAYAFREDFDSGLYLFGVGVPAIAGAGFPVMSFSGQASAANYIAALNSAASGAPGFYAQGSDANVSLILQGKGTSGPLLSDGSGKSILSSSGVASAVNFVAALNAAAGGAPGFYAQGTDTNVALILQGKGMSGPLLRDGAGFPIMLFGGQASAANYIAALNSAASGTPGFYAQGSDANVSLIFHGKGTGGGLMRDGAGATRVQWNSTGVGFYGSTPVAKPTVTGSRGGNAALASLLTALANLGLITDSTTA